MPLIIVAIKSSARLNACFSCLLPASFSSLSFSIAITVSQLCRSVVRPLSAFTIRAPSSLNGIVTTEITIAPISRASDATTGAQPVPVPPPSPHVTKTRSAPCSASRISFLLSSAAFFPISGKPPAPSPLVRFLPISILLSACELARWRASVFNITVCAPFTPLRVSALTVLQPPPPQPTTSILALCVSKSAMLLNESDMFFTPRMFCSIYLSEAKFLLIPLRIVTSRSSLTSIVQFIKQIVQICRILNNTLSRRVISFLSCTRIRLAHSQNNLNLPCCFNSVLYPVGYTLK